MIKEYIYFIIVQLKKVQIEAFIAEIEKLNDVLKKKVNTINELTVKLNSNESHLQEKREEY